MDWLNSFLTNWEWWAGGISASAVILWVLQKIPNDKIQRVIFKAFYWLGKVITLGLSEWKWTKKFWNTVIEPWFIDLIENSVETMVSGFVSGLRVDND